MMRMKKIPLLVKELAFFIEKQGGINENYFYGNAGYCSTGIGKNY